MTDPGFQQQIKDLASSCLQRKQEMNKNKQQQDLVTSQTSETVQTILQQFGNEVLQCDDHLFQSETPEGVLGLVISYRKRTHSSRPSFRVAVTCQTDTAKVSVSDGHWRQIPGILGAWADWTDEQTVYSGTPDAGKLQKSLQPAFLQWYASAMQAPDED